jgi:hypothetical protein
MVSLSWIKHKKYILKEGVMFIEKSSDTQLLFANVMHLVEKLSFDILLTLTVEKSLICLVGIQEPTVSLIERELRL